MYKHTGPGPSTYLSRASLSHSELFSCRVGRVEADHWITQSAHTASSVNFTIYIPFLIFYCRITPRRKGSMTLAPKGKGALRACRAAGATTLGQSSVMSERGARARLRGCLC
ncbi:hypothetical protein DL93DRAFT_2079446 [Clavulina sp. PMI_390]|nr:hypothetical protein DL93DRAFT_2079446 [Clavulina sp. PMI_390]